jgi:hypothetical protein
VTKPALAAALIAVVLLGGCSDAKAGASDLPTLKTSPPSHVAASPSPTKTLPDGVPTRPPAAPRSADRKSDASAKAYAKYALATYWYAVSRRDIDSLLALTPHGTCPTCKETAHNLSTGPETYEVPDRTPTPTQTVILDKDGSVWHLMMRYNLPAGTRIYGDGSHPDERLDGQKNSVMEVDLIWGNGTWKLGQYRFPNA